MKFEYDKQRMAEMKSIGEAIAALSSIPEDADFLDCVEPLIERLQCRLDNIRNRYTFSTDLPSTKKKAVVRRKR